MADFSALVILFSLSLLQFFLVFATYTGNYATKLTITNNCNDIIWPAVLPNSGSPPLSLCGFSLNPGESETLPVPSGWSGRVWGRTHCTASATGNFSCATGDCGSSAVDCDGEGDGKFSPPATVAEFTINAPTSLDTYSVSVIDGYNLPVTVVPRGTVAGSCATTGCSVDYDTVNSAAELRLSYGSGNESVGLKSGCEAFGEGEYCCSNGNYSSSKIACKQNSYSEQFKNWCPQAQTFACDTTGTTFTCEAENYVVYFCTKSGYTSTPTGTRTVPEDQGSDNIYGKKDTNSKFGIIVGAVVSVIGIMLIFWFWRWRFKSEGESSPCTSTSYSSSSSSLHVESRISVLILVIGRSLGFWPVKNMGP